MQNYHHQRKPAVKGITLERVFPGPGDLVSLESSPQRCNKYIVQNRCHWKQTAQRNTTPNSMLPGPVNLVSQNLVYSIKHWGRESSAILLQNNAKEWEKGHIPR